MAIIINRKTKNKILLALLIIISFLFLLPQAKVLAYSADAGNKMKIIDNKNILQKEKIKITKKRLYTKKHLPIVKSRIIKNKIVTVTAYNAVPWQTDNSPCISADGTNVCQTNLNIVAANWLPFGTKIRIPEYFGDTIFVVHDRMNKKFSERLDILMKSVPQAKKFGAKRLKVEIIK